MSKIAILADTSHDLTLKHGKEFGLEILSYLVRMDETDYKDQVDIDSKEFYKVMGEHETLSTGVPPVQDVIDLLDRLKAEGVDQVIMITSTSKLTGMRQLYEVVMSSYEGMEWDLFETDFAASAVALFSIRAAEMRNQGKSRKEIMTELERLRSQTSIHAIFRTLKYVIKGGRFNKYTGLIGSLLNINPLLTISDGEITILSKSRGKRKSFNALVDKIKTEIKGAQSYKMIIFSGDNPEEVALLQEALEEEIKGAETYLVTEFTPVLGVHAGPNSLGASVMILDEK